MKHTASEQTPGDDETKCSFCRVPPSVRVKIILAGHRSRGPHSYLSPAHRRPSSAVSAGVGTDWRGPWRGRASRWALPWGENWRRNRRDPGVTIYRLRFLHIIALRIILARDLYLWRSQGYLRHESSRLGSRPDMRCRATSEVSSKRASRARTSLVNTTGA